MGTFWHTPQSARQQRRFFCESKVVDEFQEEHSHELLQPPNSESPII